jgi:hypothetical protein
MKCISLIQPWATLVILGVKGQETRTWGTLYRGELAIHAAKKFPEVARRLCQEEPFRSILRRSGFMSGCDLPRGAILGTVQLADCRAITDQDQLSLDHLAYIDRSRGRWVWRFNNPKPLTRPLLSRGQMGIYNAAISQSGPAHIDLTQATTPLLISNQQ